MSIQNYPKMQFLFETGIFEAELQLLENYINEVNYSDYQAI
jgi:hypothetical protein